MKKGTSQRVHFKNRMQQRFGITVNRHGLRGIKQLIHDDKTAFVRKQSRRVSVHALTWEGQLIHVCYDKQRGELVTALLPEWEDEECQPN